MNKKIIPSFSTESLANANLSKLFDGINFFAENNVIEDRIVLVEEEIPHSQMTASASSFEPVYEPQNVIDGNGETLWHTPWDGSIKLPQSLTLDLGGINNVSSIKVKPRPSGFNGMITRYELYAIKGDAEVKIASGKWAEDHLAKSIVLSEVVSADKIKIVVLEAVGNCVSIDEVNIYRSMGEAEKLVSYNNKSITSDSTTVNITNDMEFLGNLKEGTIVARFNNTAKGIQALFGLSNNKSNNEYLIVYTNGDKVGFELRSQSIEGSIGAVTTNLKNQYEAVTLNKGINTIALKVTNGVGYKIFVNGSLAIDMDDTNVKFLSFIQDANTIFIGKVDKYSGNKYVFNGDVDFIDIYGRPVSDNYLLRKTGETALPSEDELMPSTIYKSKPENIFYSGYLGSNNYRIPALFTTKAGTVLASIDARISSGGDSPNNIDTAIRRKVLNSNGEYEWEEGIKVISLPEDASTIDTSLLQDSETGRIFIIVTTFASGYGFPNSKTGSGYTRIEKDDVVYKYRSLYDNYNNLYTIRENGIVYDSNGNPTEYKVTENNMDIYKGEIKIDNVMTSTSPLKVLGTSFLSLIYSDDDGITWSDPIDLNKQLKSDWMRFLGTGPGRGCQVKNGQYSGRLIFPVYLTNSLGFQSSAVIYSDDNGDTWNIGETANDGRDLGNGQVGNAKEMTSGLQLTESQVIEMPNGQLKLFMRNTGSYVRIATSFDGGATWDPDVYEDKVLEEPDCQLSVINYSKKIDGKDAVIFSNPNSSNDRKNGTVRIGFINQVGVHSNGEPKYIFEWKYKKLIKLGYYAYSCLTELSNGDIGVFYEGTDNTSMSYVEIGIDYIKYNIKDSIEPAAIKLINIIDEDNKYIKGENINLKITFNQSVSLIGDKYLTINIGGKDIVLTLIPGGNSKEFSFVGRIPEDIESGEHKIVLKANLNTRILNTLGNSLILNRDMHLNTVIDIEK